MWPYFEEAEPTSPSPEMKSGGQRPSSWLWKAFSMAVLNGLLVITPFLSVGCGGMDRPALNETDERSYQRGKTYLRQGRVDDALIEFLSVIDSRPNAPESHFEVGRIYLEAKDNPLLAIYHFTRYLEMNPNARQAPFVREMIDTATKEFTRTLPGRPFGDGSEDLMQRIETIRAENVELKRLLAQERRRSQRLEEQLRQRQGEPRSSSREERSSGDSRPADSYVVEPGDTLTSISRKVYGTTGRWREIFEANRHILRSENDLRVGQTLRIP